MTPQEQQLLEEFIQRLTSVQGVAGKDLDAERLIRQRLADHPDAMYLLVQRCLLQQQALDNAKNEIARLQSQTGNQSGGSFLAGGGPQADGARTAVPAAASPQLAAGPSAAAQPSAPAASSKVPSFLSSAATTAAGVAGGMFLFEGIESLLGGHGHGGFGSAGQSEVIQENIVQNNYYQSSDDQSPDDDTYDASDANYFDDADMGGDDGGWI